MTLKELIEMIDKYRVEAGRKVSWREIYDAIPNHYMDYQSLRAIYWHYHNSLKKTK